MSPSAACCACFCRDEYSAEAVARLASARQEMRDVQAAMAKTLAQPLAGAGTKGALPAGSPSAAACLVPAEPSLLQALAVPSCLTKLSVDGLPRLPCQLQPLLIHCAAQSWSRGGGRTR